VITAQAETSLKQMTGWQSFIPEKDMGENGKIFQIMNLNKKWLSILSFML
jgi:hypothetical protein